MRYISVILLFLAFSSNLQSEENMKLFEEANKLYSEQKYRDAIISYEKIIDSGFVSSELLYNLGNAFFKIEDIPNAILYYEKAKKINPNDDVDHNLKIANLKIIDNIEPIPKFFFYEWIDSIIAQNSSSNWALISIMTAWLSIIFIAIIFFTTNQSFKKISLYLSIITISLVIIFYFFANKAYIQEYEIDYAILMTPSSYVKSSPESSSKDLFILHEGVKFQILDRVGDWSKIKLADGNVGWVLSSDFETI